MVRISQWSSVGWLMRFFYWLVTMPINYLMNIPFFFNLAGLNLPWCFDRSLVVAIDPFTPFSSWLPRFCLRRFAQRKAGSPNRKSIFFKPLPVDRAVFLDFLSIQERFEFQNGQESGLQGDAEGEAGFVLCWDGERRRRSEWHAARLAGLKTSHTITWEEFKKKQKEDELKRDELEADKDRMMREYRAQLDAERARKLALGRNHSASKSHHKKDRKSKESNKRSSRKRKHKRSSESSSSSSSESLSGGDDDYENGDGGESRRSKKKRKYRSRVKYSSSSSSSDSKDNGGPVRLSKFFGITKR